MHLSVTFKIKFFYTKEDIMVEVTEVAEQQITEQLKGREVSAIRIFLNEGG
jgi:Fe-S cluster assembly iron-binding protein IscA